MNDIERYNFWHLEQDAFIKKQELDNAIKGLPTWDSLEKLFCEAIKNGRRLEI